MTEPGKKQRVVIYRLGSLGDTVVALPAFHKVAKTWPEAERIVLTNVPVSSNAAPLDIILRDSGLIHRTIAYPVGTRSIVELWRLARHLRGLDAEVLVYLTSARGLLNVFRDLLFFKLCGFASIVGAPRTRALQQCRIVDGGGGEGQPDEERECQRIARCLVELGPIDLDDPAVWDLRLTDNELHAGSAILTPFSSIPYFAINMGGKAREKDWGLANWRAFAAELTTRYPNAGMLVVGAVEDVERAQQIAKVWRGPLIDACGRLSPRESAAAMRNAMLFIGHDSGPLHLAAAMGVRCVGLFGSYNRPKRWHPWGRQHRIIHRMAGLQTITVTDVIDVVDEIMPRRQECA